MGAVPYHQAKATEFLQRADRAMSHDDAAQAAQALSRAASHAATALAVHNGFKHNSRRRLEYALQLSVAAGRLSRSHLKTFRQTYSFPQRLASPPAHHPPAPPARPEPVEGRPSPSFPPRPESSARTAITLRRLRRRVAAMLTAVAAFINGQPKPVHYHKLWLRKPDRPLLPDLHSARDILTLPNYAEIRSRFNLFDAPLAAEPDPHGWYDLGSPPIRCPCHADLWDRHNSVSQSRITLSPLWRRALEKTFRTKRPDPLQLSC